MLADALDAGSSVNALARGVSIVGRQTETHVVRSVFDDHGFCFIEGQPGGGKTRLVSDVLATVDDGRSLLVRCQPFAEHFGLAPVADAIRERRPDPARFAQEPISGALRPVFPEWADKLPQSFAASTAQHTLRAMRFLITHLGIDVVVVEDAQHADNATCDMMMLLADAPDVALVVTIRDAVSHGAQWPAVLSHLRDRATAAIVLKPFDDEETKTFVSALLGGAHVSSSFAALLRERTGGNPLILDQAVRQLVQQGDLVNIDGVWVRRRLDELRVPSSADENVQRSLKVVSPAARAVVEAVSILGQSESETLVRSVAEVAGELGQVVSELVDHGLISRDARGRVQMRHAALSVAVRERIDPGRARAMHGRALDGLSSRQPVPVHRLARHARQSGRVREASVFCEQGAVAALAAGNVVDAVNSLRAMLAEPDLEAADGVRLAGLLPLWGLVDRADIDEVQARLSGWLLDDLKLELEAELRFHRARMQFATGAWEEGFRDFEAATGGLNHRPDLLARACAILGSGWGSPDDARRHRTRAMSLLPHLDAALSLDIRLDVGTAAVAAAEPCDWRQLKQLPRTATHPGLASTVARTNLNVGDIAVKWGDPGEAADRLRHAREQSAHHELTRLHYLALVTSATLAWNAGDSDSVGDLLGQLGRHPGADPHAPVEVQLLQTVSKAGLNLSDQLAAATVIDELQELAQLSLRVFGASEAVQVAVLAVRGYHDLGRNDVAVNVGSAVIDAVRAAGNWLFVGPLLASYGAALIASGQRTDVSRLRDVVRDAVGNTTSPVLAGALSDMDGLLVSDPERAVEAHTRAAAHWHSAGRLRQRLHSQQWQAQALLGVAPARGRSLLRATAEQHRRLGDVTGVLSWHAVAPLLDRSSADPRTRGYGNALSPHELDVVRHVADGRTNAQIARLLHRSPKTVSNQLRSAMLKLEVPNRAAAAVRAVELGLFGDAVQL